MEAGPGAADGGGGPERRAKARAALPADARAALKRYLALLDGALPAAEVAGVYVTGSAALDDWRPGRSDLDVLTVTAGGLGEASLAALRAAHAAAGGRPHLDAVYVPRSQVGGRGQADAGSPHVVDGVFHDGGQVGDPVLWAILDRHAVTVRGPAAGALGAGPDPGWLRDWNRANLASYWRPWAARARQRLAGRGAAAPLPAESVCWALLGAGRLHHTIATGGIISKTAGVAYTATVFPRFAALLCRARAWRLGDDAAAFSVADGWAACDLVDAVVDSAGEA